MNIPVLWWGAERGSWSCANMLNQMFDFHACKHYTRMDDPIKDGAVLVFHGQNLSMFGGGAHNCDRINEYVEKWRWVIFVSIGDEGCDFPYHLLSHRNSKRWVQAPIITTWADRFLIQGLPEHSYRPDPMPDRDLDYFFSGQVTHERRRLCHSSMIHYWEKNPNGVIHATSGFGKGLPKPDYLHMLARTKVAPCPAGPATVDTFRVYEALEMGAIPILDTRSLRAETEGVWPMLLGNHPLPIVNSWDDYQDMMQLLLNDWDVRSRVCQAWWGAYKRKFMNTWLAQDLVSLGALDPVEVSI